MKTSPPLVHRTRRRTGVQVGTAPPTRLETLRLERVQRGPHLDPASHHQRVRVQLQDRIIWNPDQPMRVFNGDFNTVGAYYEVPSGVVFVVTHAAQVSLPVLTHWAVTLMTSNQSRVVPRNVGGKWSRYSSPVPVHGTGGIQWGTEGGADWITPFGSADLRRPAPVWDLGPYQPNTRIAFTAVHHEDLTSEEPAALLVVAVLCGHLVPAEELGEVPGR